MTIKPFYKVFAALLMSVTMMGANANSISVDCGSCAGAPGDTLLVTVNYDFTDDPMFGGGMDLAFDTGSLQFVSFTQAPLTGAPGTPQPAASPVGSLAGPGEYNGFGVGTFDFFVGINTAGSAGTFEFILGGAPSAAGGGTPCGSALCLSGNPGNPMTSIANGNVTGDLFPGGFTGVDVQVNPIPVPAAVWFMLSGIGALMGLRRRS